jgi:hypothetical protein
LRGRADGSIKTNSLNARRRRLGEWSILWLADLDVHAFLGDLAGEVPMCWVEEPSTASIADIDVGRVTTPHVRFGSMLSIKALREAPNGDSVC